MTTVRYTLEQAKKLESKTDWEQVKALSEAEIHAAALDDPDAQPLTEDQMKRFKRVVPRGNGVYGYDKNQGSQQAASK